jgi:hypothetical protein
MSPLWKKMDESDRIIRLVIASFFCYIACFSLFLNSRIAGLLVVTFVFDVVTSFVYVAYKQKPKRMPELTYSHPEPDYQHTSVISNEPIKQTPHKYLINKPKKIERIPEPVLIDTESSQVKELFIKSQDSELASIPLYKNEEPKDEIPIYKTQPIISAE